MFLGKLIYEVMAMVSFRRYFINFEYINIMQIANKCTWIGICPRLARNDQIAI